MAIPDAALPGYESLRRRVEQELGLLREGRSVDYKRSASWDELRWKLTKTCLAMANLRDGGIVVIGISEERPSWDVTGIGEDHLRTFDVDTIIGQMNAFASRPLPLEIVTVSQGAVQLLVLSVGPLQGTPIICARNTPDSVPLRDRLEEGAIYVRPDGVARTKKLSTAAEMHELIEMAAEIRAGELLGALNRIQQIAGAPGRERARDADLFAKERGDL